MFHPAPALTRGTFTIGDSRAEPRPYVAHVLLALVLTFLPPVPARAQTVAITLEPLGPTFSQPVLVTGARDGTGRLFVVEQEGRVRVLEPGQPAASILLDIRSRVLDGGERGLLGLAFHPQFASNRRFFVNYTRRPDGATVVAEYRDLPQSPVTDPDQTVLLVVSQPFANHNGGMIAFGPDGYLYVAAGDGGSGNDPGNRAQNVNDLLGKMLRIDVDDRASDLVPYVSPASNPFVGLPGRDEIFATGLRNPWRFSFDSETGDLWAGDVGQNAREEVDIVTLGGNYGWRVREGTLCTGLGPGICAAPDLIPPVTEYANGPAGRCSVTGGYVYRGSRQSLPYGAYVFGDFCTGEIFMFREGAQSLLLDTSLLISSFGEDDSGEIYVVDHGGTVHRIVSPAAPDPTLRSFDLSPNAIRSWTTAGAPTLATGYARIRTGPGTAVWSGTAIVEHRSGGVLVSEAAIRATRPVSSGRIRAEVSAGINTGIALANPNDHVVAVSFHFTGADGADFGHGELDVPAAGQVAGFLSEVPFGVAEVHGTFTFAAESPVSAAALRGALNSRGDFLLSHSPVFELDSPRTSPVWIPLFSDGGGWSTEIVLLNPGDEGIDGALTVGVEPAGPVAFDLGSGPTLAYSIPPRSALTLRSVGAGGVARTGSVRVDSAAGTVPQAFAILRYAPGGVVVSESAVGGQSASPASRVPVESSGALGAAGSARHGIAITNTADQLDSVAYELIASDGMPTGLAGSIPVPAGVSRAMFVDQMPGLEAMPTNFTGTLRMETGSAMGGMTAVGLRARWNERGEFLFTTESAGASAPEGEILIPHFALGPGYQTRFVLVGGDAPSSGTVQFFDPAGAPAALPLR